MEKKVGEEEKKGEDERGGARTTRAKRSGERIGRRVASPESSKKEENSTSAAPWRWCGALC